MICDSFMLTNIHYVLYYFFASYYCWPFDWVSSWASLKIYLLSVKQVSAVCSDKVLLAAVEQLCWNIIGLLKSTCSGTTLSYWSLYRLLTNYSLSSSLRSSLTGRFSDRGGHTPIAGQVVGPTAGGLIAGGYVSHIHLLNVVEPAENQPWDWRVCWDDLRLPASPDVMSWTSEDLVGQEEDLKVCCGLLRQ